MKLKLNKRATWIVDVRKVLERLLESDQQGFPGIPLEEFNSKKDWKIQNQLLRQMLPEVLKAAQVPTRGSLSCPMHDDENPSLEYRSLVLGFHCYVCARHKNHVWDMLDIIGIAFGVWDFGKKRRMAIQMFVGYDESNHKEAATVRHSRERLTSSHASHPIFRRKTYPVYYSDPLCRDYVESRRISAEAAMRFGLRRMEMTGTGDRYLVIPCENRFEVYRRYLKVNGSVRDDYRYPYNPHHLPELAPTLFNSRCLKDCEEGAVVFVVESAIDGILLSQSGFHALALNGADNWELLLDKLHILREKQIRVFLLLDKDDAGVKREEDLQKRLDRQGVFAPCSSILEPGVADHLQNSSFKDIGDAYVNDRVQTIRALSQIRNWAKERS